MKKLKIVLDTNILISALVFGGKPRTIYKSIILNRAFGAYSSESALNELLRVLEQKFRYSDVKLGQVERNIRENFKIIYVEKVPEIIKDDQPDNEFLAIAESAGASFIISGDKHLLNLKKYQNIQIITPAKFLKGEILH